MTENHVRFGLLSDLYDEVMDAARKESVLEHLRECSECEREFQSIGRMVRLVSCLRAICVRSGDDFTRATLSRILVCEKKRKRQTFYKKMVPSAVAALVIFFVGVDQFRSSTSVSKSGALRVAEKSGSDDWVREIGSAYDKKKTISILKQNRARILVISDAYIEAEASMGIVEDIRRECEGSIQPEMFGFARAVGYGEGGAPDGMAPFPIFMHPRTTDPSRIVRVRIGLR